MLKFKVLVPALFMSAVMLSPVNAAPVTVTTTPGVSAESLVVQVQDNGRRDGRRRSNRRDRDGRRGRSYRRGRDYRRGRRYRRPPRGWRRYSYRPYNWRTRGCIVIGPLWFCP